MTDYLTDFVQESEERITELNNALLTLERDPTNDDAMESIFRVAHTLKSNCGAMGLESASDLAHAIEDLLDAVRRDETEVTPELMDVIFDGVDELETMIDEVADDGEIETDPTETIEALRSQLESGEESAAITTPTTDEIDDVISRFDPPADGDHHAYLARLSIAEREDVNNGQLVVEALIDAFDLIGTEPPQDEVEAGNYDGQFDAVFGSAVGETAIMSGLDPVEEVADFELVNVSNRFDAIPDADTDEAAAEPTPEPGDGISTEDAENLEVDELLDEFDEFDNLDEMVDDVANDDLEAFEDMGEAGSFDDLLDEDELDDDPVESSVDDETAATAESSTADDEEDVDDANAVFNELKDEVEMVGFDELQDELDELEFDEFDNDDEVDMDELIGDDIDDDSFLSDTEPTDEAIDDMLVEVDDAQTADDGNEKLLEDDDLTPTVDDVEDSMPAADDADAELEADAVDETALDAEVDAEADADSAPIAVEPSESEPPSTDPVAADTTDDAADNAAIEPGTDSTEAEPVADETDSAPVEDKLDQPADETAAEKVEASADDSDAVGVDDTLEVEDAAAGDDSLDDAADVASKPDDDTGSADEFGAAKDEVGSTASAAEETTDADSEPAEDPFDDKSVGDDPFAADTAEDSPDSETDPFAADNEDDPFAADAEDDPFAADDEDDPFAADTEDDPFAEDSFADDFGFDESDEDDEFEPVEAASSGAEDDEFDAVFDEDDFADTFGDDGFDDGGFDSSSTTTSSTESTAESFGDEDASADDHDGVVRRIDEPAFENPELTLPEADDRPDADQQTDEIQSVRVDVEQIDSLLTLVEGLVTSRVRLRHAVTEGEDHSALEKELDDLEDLTTDLQETVMDVRLVPLQTVTNRLPRVVRDIAREQKKEVSFEISGEDVELDRSILDRIGDPLIHLVRNAVDHGIEAPNVRESAEKSPEGVVEVHADRERDRVSLTVEDDGSGLDPNRLRSEAVDAGILTEDEASELPDDEAYDLIFHPGLSTADEVTDVSGRGVGMDVVKRTIEDLEGTVSIDSDPGAGTSVTMTLPVSVAIDDILFLECGGEEFGVPTKAVLDIEPADRLETVDGQPVLVDATNEYPVIELDDALETPRAGANGEGMVVRIRDDVRSVALHCDHVHGQQEVVVKPFEGFMSDIPGLSGATVRGRGEVVNILDVTTL